MLFEVKMGDDFIVKCCFRYQGGLIPWSNNNKETEERRETGEPLPGGVYRQPCVNLVQKCVFSSQIIGSNLIVVTSQINIKAPNQVQSECVLRSSCVPVLEL